MTTSSEVYLSGTGTDPAVRAAAVLADDAERLLLTFKAKAGLLTELDLDGATRRQAYTGLVEFTTGEVRPYLAATDRVLYATAAGAAGTRLLVRAARRLRDVLDRHADELVRASTPDQAGHVAQAFGEVLAACLDIDRTVLVPALAELPGADLPGLVEDLRTLRGGGDLDEPGPHFREHAAT